MLALFLMRPQRLFGTRGGATGTFTIDDKCDTLSLDGKPYLQIPYDSKSYIPVALARNSNASSSPIEFNMSVLSNENTNLNPSQTFLLLWYQTFGHRNMHSIQHMFCNVRPFSSPNFTGAAKIEKLNVKHVNIQRLTDISQRVPLPLLNLIPMVI